MALEQAVLGAEEVGGLLYTALLTLLVPLTLSKLLTTLITSLDNFFKAHRLSSKL